MEQPPAYDANPADDAARPSRVAGSTAAADEAESANPSDASMNPANPSQKQSTATLIPQPAVVAPSPPPSGRRKGFGGGCRNIGLLLHKNFLVRRRHVCLCCCELCAPLFLCLLLAIPTAIGIYLVKRSGIDAALGALQTDSSGNPCMPSFTGTGNQIARDSHEGEPRQRSGETGGTSREKNVGPSSDCNEIQFEGFNVACGTEINRTQGSSCVVAVAPDTAFTLAIVDMLIAAQGGRGHTIEWRLYKSEKQIDKTWKAHNLQKLMGNASSEDFDLRAAIIFDGESGSYKIRMVDRPPPSRTSGYFPQEVMEGTVSAAKDDRTKNTDINFDDSLRYQESGFTSFQIAVERALVSKFTGKDPKFNITIKRLPVPEHKLSIASLSSTFRGLWFDYFLPLLFVLGFIFTVPSVMRGVISERESGMKELLKIYGMSNWMHWCAWIFTCTITSVISLTFITGVLFAVSIVAFGNFVLVWIMLMLYGFACISFLLFLASFFEKPSVGVAFGLVIWVASFFILWVAVALSHDTYRLYTLGNKLAIGLIPHMSMVWGMKIIGEYEKRGVGLGFNHLFQPLTSVDTLNFALVLIMLVVDIFLYLLLALYFEAVLPSAHGTRKPFYFIFRPLTPQFWRKPQVAPMSLEVLNRSPETGFENEPVGLPIGLEIRDLVKIFDRKAPSVAGVSLKMYQGDIFALLGHNGAGKTTTISCCIGMMAPTAGTVIVNGYDIKTNLDIVRSQIGICLQHNLLFDEMNVMEHMTFFARVRGVGSTEAQRYSQNLATRIQLGEKLQTRSPKLSGGQKRKLCLGIAFVGGAKVVFLDEPTSGMDVEARRAIWDVILTERDGRTIILTTHFMEEADVLGDRIGIMTDGVLQCCGTPVFLKQFYGAGYTLTLTSDDEGKCEATLEVVKKTISDARLKDKPAVISRPYEWSILLPTESVSTEIFPAMFKALESNKASLGILHMALSQTTLDEVFLKAGETRRDMPQKPNGEGTVNEILLKEEAPVTGVLLFLKQFWGLLLKRASFSWGKKSLLWSEIFIPMLLMLAVVLNAKTTVYPTVGVPSREISFKDYLNTHTYYMSSPAGDADHSRLESEFVHIVDKSSEVTKIKHSGKSLNDKLLELGKGDSFFSFKEKNILAAQFGNVNFTVMYSIFPYHSSPLAINVASNTILKYGGVKNKEIRVTNHPLEFDEQATLNAYTPQFMSYTINAILFFILMSLALTVLVSTFVIAPVEERICSGKQLQLMTGTSAVTYWLAFYVWDCFIMIMAFVFMALWFPIFQATFFINDGALGTLLLIILLHGFSAIPFSYLWSLMANSSSSGYAFLTIVHILTGLVIPLIMFGLQLALQFCLRFPILINILATVLGPTKKEVETDDSIPKVKGMSVTLQVLTRIFRVFPAFGSSSAMFKFADVALNNAQCDLLPSDFQQVRCGKLIPTKPPGWDFRRCCKEWCNKIEEGCYKPNSLYAWNYDSFLPTDSMFGASFSGLGQELAYMFLLGIFYNILLLCVEFGVISKMREALHRTPKAAFDAFAADEDVHEESQRVRELVATGRVNEDALIIDDFCKSYGSFSAVSHLSFGVHYGECFGLLGVNGAGKTTTFRMLTGDEPRSSGNAYAKNCNLDESRTQFMKDIGYCPQFDGLIGVLTGRQMIILFGRLRGVRAAKLECNKWLKNVGLMESANVQCRKYSGGMKRRLCAAMAMIGNPNIVLLDEPTSGVDPVARREFWKIIFAIKDSGRSIILTSHSMDEIAACCLRLGIMVNGEMQCLGSVQHLKHKYAQGFTLIVKLKPYMIPESNSNASEFQGDVSMTPSSPSQSPGTGGQLMANPKLIQKAQQPQYGPVPYNSQHMAPQPQYGPVAYNSQPIMAPQPPSIQDPMAERAAKLNESIVERLSPCTLKDEHKTTLQYQIHNADVPWDVLFTTMEELKASFSDIMEEYTISDTSLEEVFLAFARAQYPARAATVSGCKKCMKCECFG